MTFTCSISTTVEYLTKRSGYLSVQALVALLHTHAVYQLRVRVVACPAGGAESRTGHTHTHTHTDDRRGRGSSGRSRLEPPADTGGGRVVSDRGAVNRTNHEERRHRGDGEVPEPGQRQRPAGGEALRGGGAGVRLPCLLLRVDSE